MHWSETIAQLAATLFMTGLRSFVRRRLAMDPFTRKVPAGYEMEWLATKLAKDKTCLWPDDITKDIGPNGDDSRTEGHLGWEMASADDSSLKELAPTWTEAQRAMKIRERLGKLSRWTGLASGLGVSLATAIEAVMDQISTPEFGNQFIWSIQARFGGSDRIEDKQDIFFTIQKQRTWRVESTELEAALSLWIFAVNDRESSFQQSRTGASDWLRRDVLLSRKQSIRLLGPNIESFRRDMTWWTGFDTPDVIKVDVESLLELVLLEPDMSGTNSDNLREHVHIDPHRILEYGNDKITKDIPKLFAYQKELFRDDIGYSPKLPDNPVPPHTHLATISNLPLEMVFTQDLFSSFMYAVVHAKMCSIEGTVVCRKDDKVEELPWYQLKLEDPTLTRMVLAVERSGLMSQEEIFMSIIPPLSMNEGLSDMSSVFLLAQEKVRESVLRIGLDHAGEIYLRLFQICKAFGLRHKNALKATAHLAELFILLNTSIEFWGDYRHKQNYPSYELRSKVWTALKTTDEGVFNSLVEIYRKPGLSKIYEDRSLILANEYRPSISNSEQIELFEQTDETIKLLSSYTSPISGLQFEPKCTDIFGRSALHYCAAKYEIPKMTFDRSLHYLRYADINGWTPLHYYYAWNNHSRVPISIIVQIPEMMGMPGIAGTTPLHCAALRGCYSLARLIIESGDDPDVRDMMNVTPLHYATYKGPPEIATCLLDARADIEAKGISDENPMHLAAIDGNVKVLEILLDRGAKGEARNIF